MLHLKNCKGFPSCAAQHHPLSRRVRTASPYPAAMAPTIGKASLIAEIISCCHIALVNAFRNSLSFDLACITIAAFVAAENFAVPILPCGSATRPSAIVSMPASPRTARLWIHIFPFAGQKIMKLTAVVMLLSPVSTSAGFAAFASTAAEGACGHVLGSWSGKNSIARVSMDSRPGASAGVSVMVNAVWKHARDVVGSESHCLKMRISSWAMREK
mmetsp:Transcript_22610/g.59053  ORF Transcript_22610/g.59053 Transcript_22610/m.59053 type:complete len:215 (-) Transcript_22610:755-1399(-)